MIGLHGLFLGHVEGRGGMPRVELVYAYAGAGGAIIDAGREMRPDGLVIAGSGGGTYPPAFVAAAVAPPATAVPANVSVTVKPLATAVVVE